MPIEFNVNPYNDDFDANDGPRESNYMRILFKPGYAVQARELTQLQTAIQNQIKMFGDHVFKDGSQVIGGHLTFDNSVISLKIEDQFANTDVDVAEFLNKLITNDIGPSNKKAKVIAVDDTQQKKTLMIRYMYGSEFNNDEIIKVVPGNDPKARIIASESANVGSVISINEGVFYVNGFFVHVPEQTLVLEPYSRSPTYRVGLEIQETIVDESADASLLDPAQESFNYQAPGADRYQFNLVLAKRTLESIDDSSFFELLRLENGIITKQVKYPIYSEIEKTLARRTYDESGNYTVYPFRASSTNHPTEDSLFNIEIDPGKAYVKGFEFETVGKTTIPVNKARTTEKVYDYDFSLEYGNYITVNNLWSGTDGIFSTEQFANVDLHIVPSASITTTSFASYSTTLAGTARVRSLQKSISNKYDLYILDQNMLSNTFTLTSNPSTNSAFTFPSNYPTSPLGLYNGVAFTVTAGSGAGQSGEIKEYDGSRVATLQKPLDIKLDTTSVISLNYSISDVDSIVVRPTSYAAAVYGNQNPDSAVYPCMDVDDFSKSSLGETYLNRTNYNKLIYLLPETNISKTDFSDIDFYHRKYLGPITFTNGVGTLPLSGNETFYYGSENAWLSATSAAENILVLVKNKQSSTLRNGEVLDLTYDGSNGAFKFSTTRIDVTKGSSTFVADVFVNVKINNANESGSTIVKQKSLKGSNKNSISDVSYGDITSSVTGQTGTKIDATNGVVWYTNYSDIVKTPGNRQSLFISDVVKINKIYDSGSPLYLPNSTNAIDITNRYMFDTGQRDNYYDHGSIILKDGSSPPRGQTAVLLTYFQHVGTSVDGFFSRESYSDADIANNYVAVYSSSIVGTSSLLDVLDFRPRRSDSSTAFSLVGMKLPYNNLSMELSYGYYVPRIDKLAVTSNKEFKVISGIPSKYPKPPVDVQDTMTIYTMYIPPYTHKATDVKFQFHDNRRYTMRDIGRIEKRVERLEYYTQLSLLEQQAKEEVYFYDDRVIEKEKYGILVDQFDGFNVADTKNPDLLCHISFNQLKPYKKITPVEMQFTSNTGAYKLNGKTYSLAFTEEEFIAQNSATKAITVQPYLFGTFNGNIELRPELDTWISETILPEIISIDPVQNERPPDVTVPTPIVFPPPEIVNVIPAVESPVPQPAIVTVEPQPAVVTTVIPQTNDVIVPSGFDTPVFDVPRTEIQTVTNIVDAIVSPPQIDLGIFPVTPIGDLSGLSQWSLFVSDLLTTSTPVVDVPEPPPRRPTNGTSGGFRSGNGTRGVGRGSVGRGLRRA